MCITTTLDHEFPVRVMSSTSSQDLYAISSPRPTGVCHGVHVIHHVIHVSYLGLAARIALVISFLLLRQQNPTDSFSQVHIACTPEIWRRCSTNQIKESTKLAATGADKLQKWPEWNGEPSSFLLYFHRLKVKIEADRNRMGSNAAICNQIIGADPRG